MGRRVEVEAADPGAVSPLVDAARRGEAWALTEIWQRHAPAVTGYLRGRGASEPEDLTSDVFLAVFERVRSFRGGETDLRAFVFTVAHHRLVDDLRRRSRRGPTLEYDAADDARRSDSAEDEALDALHTQRVHALLGRLSDDQREVLLLRVVGDLSLEQTAAALGKRIGAVKALQHRALATLRRILDQAVSL
jgi:RNA polymerase sigma-70 factor (ECF subfamily)